jgi:hypothetical protein
MSRDHDLFRDLSRRHRLRRVTQDIVDSPATFARAKPVILAGSPRRLSRDKDVGRIKQTNGRVQMRQIGATRVGLAFKAIKNSSQFHSLLA